MVSASDYESLIASGVYESAESNPDGEKVMKSVYGKRANPYKHSDSTTPVTGPRQRVVLDSLPDGVFGVFRDYGTRVDFLRRGLVLLMYSVVCVEQTALEFTVARHSRLAHLHLQLVFIGQFFAIHVHRVLAGVAQHHRLRLDIVHQRRLQMRARHVPAQQAHRLTAGSASRHNQIQTAITAMTVLPVCVSLLHLTPTVRRVHHNPDGEILQVRLLHRLLHSHHTLRVVLSAHFTLPLHSLHHTLPTPAAPFLLLCDLEQVVTDPLTVAHQLAPTRVLARARGGESRGTIPHSPRLCSQH